MKARLGINIDHVATLRQARRDCYPSLINAAKICFKEKADQLTIHLREDRRHIQDKDVFELSSFCKEMNLPLNLELSSCGEVLDVVLPSAPDWFCLVPEKREEITTEGGLDLANEKVFFKTKETIKKIRNESSGKVSLFIEADTKYMERALELEVEAVEIHTGEFALDFRKGKNCSLHKDKFNRACSYKNLSVHAGHGLCLESTRFLLENTSFKEYNIGHWIISQSVFQGLDNVIRDFRKVIDESSKH